MTCYYFKLSKQFKFFDDHTPFVKIKYINRSSVIYRLTNYMPEFIASKKIQDQPNLIHLLLEIHNNAL